MHLGLKSATKWDPEKKHFLLYIISSERNELSVECNVFKPLVPFPTRMISLASIINKLYLDINNNLSVCYVNDTLTKL